MLLRFPGKASKKSFENNAKEAWEDSEKVFKICFYFTFPVFLGGMFV